MADNLFPFRSEDWLRLQEEYWDAWRELSGLGGATSAQAEGTPPWNQALDRWWKSVSCDIFSRTEAWSRVVSHSCAHRERRNSGTVRGL